MLVDIAQQFKNTYAIVDKALIEFEYQGCTSSTIFIWQCGGKDYIIIQFTSQSIDIFKLPIQEILLLS